MFTANIFPGTRISAAGLGTPVLLILLLAMMILPLPALMLDMFFTFNIALALIVVLVVAFTPKPLDFSAFPTVLLIATLLRLALNVASTRIVLLDGHTGSAAAGRVIEAFGEFVIGGNYTVGLVVFSVLVIINFVVVTKGAGRISEVAARFALDAMPGKQMAIDADLNAGLIDVDESRRRRQEVTLESDFYGAMDGASKFVRGDAIAGILILFINIIGGLAVGMLQHDLGVVHAAQNYTLLTIGDGLAAQIPSLVLSTAAAIMVTRVSTETEIGDQILTQVFKNPRALMITAGVVGMLGLVPGMPNLVFLALACIIGYFGYAAAVKEQQVEQLALQKQEQQPVPPPRTEIGWSDVDTIDPISIEVGYRLVPLVGQADDSTGDLLDRIRGIRKKLSRELGFLVPAVHIKDNLGLGPRQYQISIHEATLSVDEVYPDRLLAINPGQVQQKIEGVATKDPTFGLDAVWIEHGLRERAQTLGYTIVDPSTVIATHCGYLVQSHAASLLGYDDVQHLLTKLAETSPRLVEDLVPKILGLGVVHKVLQNLLREFIPIRDMRTIAETLAVSGARSQDSDELTSAVRVALGRSIVQQINGIESELAAITLDPSLEQLLQSVVRGEGDQGSGIDPNIAQKMQQSLVNAVRQQEAMGTSAVLLVPATIRSWLSKYVRAFAPDLRVLSYNEVPDNKQIRVVASVGS